MKAPLSRALALPGARRASQLLQCLVTNLTATLNYPAQLMAYFEKMLHSIVQEIDLFRSWLLVRAARG
jgi:hypothetical protein